MTDQVEMTNKMWEEVSFIMSNGVAAEACYQEGFDPRDKTSVIEYVKRYFNK